MIHAGALVGVAAAFNRRRDQVPTLAGVALSIGLARHQLSLWLDLESLGNRDASHGTLLLSGAMIVPITARLSIGGRFGLGATLVNFADPVFRDVIGVSTRFEGMLDVRLGEAWTLWLRPLAIDVLSAADLGGPIATWQARRGVAYRVPAGLRNRLAATRPRRGIAGEPTAMTASRWRTPCLVLCAICAGQLWCNLRRADTESPAGEDRPAPHGLARAGLAQRDATALREPCIAPASEHVDDGAALYGFKIPSWAIWLAPHPGEDLRSYRDRLLPLGLAVIGPQRARVARSRDAFLGLARLDARQRAELDAATREAAEALQDRVMSAALNGEFSPETFKPMAGIALASDLLGIVGRGNRRFLDALRDDQRAALAQHPFDFADYVVFSTRWEDTLGP